VDKTKRVRLFYETADPLAPLTTRAAEQALSGGSSSNGVLSTETQQPPNSGVTFTSSLPQGRIRYKTFRNGTWGESYPFPLASAALAQQDPAAVELSDGRILVAWIDVVNPNTDLSLVRPLEYHLRFRLGNVSSPQPAQLKGQRREPFNVAPGARLLFRGNWPEEEEGFEFVARDFSTPQQAKAEEVKDVLNSRLRHVIASVDPKNRTLLLSTVDTGGDKRLEIDLRSSSAAQSLGFDAGNSVAIGDWGEIITWSAPRDVTPATLGLSTDLHALFDGSIVWLFWATYDVSTSNWQIVNSRWDGKTWSNLEVVADGIGGNREPFAILDTKKHIWLFWSRRQGVGTIEDNWTLDRRVFDGISWGPEGLVTSTPTDGDKRAADREPSAVHVPNSDALRIFFRSDRVSTITDGMKLWSLTLSTSTDAVAVTVPPSPITTDYNADYTPSPVQMPGNTLWLLFRSDRSVSLSRAAIRSLPVLENRATYPAPVVSAVSAGPVRSVRVPDAGTLHRYAGSTSVVLSNMARNARQRQWDDLLAYTPQKPQGEALQDDDFYTRGTVGLYLNQVTPDSPLSQQRVDRLRPVLERFLPINVRAIVILATPAVSEDVYIDTAILDSYQDTFPYLEDYEGPGEDRIGLVLPDWRLLRSNTPDDVSANPSDLTSLRHRPYSKDPPLP